MYNAAPATSSSTSAAPPHRSSAPVSSPQTAFADTHGMDVRNAPSPLAAALSREWQEVLSQWSTRAATTLRDRSPPGPDGLWPAARWGTCLANARNCLPADLRELARSPALCRLFGLERRLPDTFSDALLAAAGEEARQDTLAGRVDGPSALSALLYIERCLQRPACEVLANPVMMPVLTALHSRSPGSPDASSGANTAPADAVQPCRE